jgi:site-specific recombinase XerD
MRPPAKAHSAAERYDRSRLSARDHRLPPNYPRPQPTSAWPPENVALLEDFRVWLLSSGTSRDTVDHLYIPMAGNALGLNLKPHRELDLDADLRRGLGYVQAKRLSAEWTGMCRNALAKFRTFLRQQRGAAEVALRPLNHQRYCADLPDWLVQELLRYQHSRQHQWRPARLNEQISRFWSGHSRMWRWLCSRYTITRLQDVRRQYLLDYAGHQLAAGYAPATVNQDLRYFHAFLQYLQEQDYAVPQALLRLPAVKQPDRLPRFLTDEEVRRLRDDLEGRASQPGPPAQKRNALLDRAAFYLLWQAGLRLGEVEELRTEDLDLPGRKVMVRQGKGLRDRTAYLTDAALHALQAYLAVRGQGPDSHVLLYRNQPVKKDLIHSRIGAAGQRAGVHAYPHRLRHTMATQLLNAGCRVTSIQRLLGHKRLNSTMIYARVHDRTVAADYYAAMAEVEERLELDPSPADAQRTITADERAQVLLLADCLAEPDLSLEARLDVVAQVRRLLACGRGVSEEVAGYENGRRQRDRPPPSPVLLGAVPL